MPNTIVRTFDAGSIFPDTNVNDTGYIEMLNLHLQNILPIDQTLHFAPDDPISGIDAAVMMIGSQKYIEDYETLDDYFYQRAEVNDHWSDEILWYTEEYDIDLGFKWTLPDATFYLTMDQATSIVAQAFGILPENMMTDWDSPTDMYRSGLVERNIINKSMTKWARNETMTRVEFAMLLSRVLMYHDLKCSGVEVLPAEMSMTSSIPGLQQSLPVHYALPNENSGWVEALHYGLALYQRPGKSDDPYQMYLWGHSSEDPNYPAKAQPYGDILKHLWDGAKPGETVPLTIDGEATTYVVADVQRMVPKAEVDTWKQPTDHDLVLTTCEKDIDFRQHVWLDEM